MVAQQEDQENLLTEPLLTENSSTREDEAAAGEINIHTTNNHEEEEEEGEGNDEDAYVLISTEHDACYLLDPQRFIVLTVFSLCNLLASAVWITFAPIEDAVKVKYNGISGAQVNWLSMIFMLLYGPGTAICAWSIRRFGLRQTVVISALCMTVGCFLRWWSIYFVVIDNDDNSNNNDATANWAYILLLTGQGMVAISQPVFANAPARVAASWFQKTTQAIGISVFAAMIGMVFGQAMSPLLVVEATGDHLGTLMFGQAVGMVFCCIGTWWYFESEPASPPSAAEAARRRRQPPSPQPCPNADNGDNNTQQSNNDEQPNHDHDMSAVWTDVKALFTDKQYIIMLVAFGLCYGANNAILTLLQPWIAAAGFPGDETAGLLGSLTIAGGVIGTLIAAPLLDASRNYNQAVRWSFTVSFIVAVLSVATLHPSSPKWILAVAFTAMGMTQLPLLTICLDAAAAHSYPIPEELSSAGLQLVGQYLGIAMIDFMGSLLENDKEAKGYKGQFNIAFLTFLGISAAAALCYNGDDPRATANQLITSGGVETGTAGDTGGSTPVTAVSLVGSSETERVLGDERSPA